MNPAMIRFVKQHLIAVLTCLFTMVVKGEPPSTSQIDNRVAIDSGEAKGMNGGEPVDTSTEQAPPAEAKETAAQLSSSNEVALTFKRFVNRVESNNLNYAAQKFNVSIAEAQISLARLWPNPVLSGGFNTPFNQSTSVKGVDPSTLTLPTDASLPSTTSASLSETIPLGGKMSARVGVAKSNAAQVKAQVEDFFRNLRGNSAGSFIDALTAQLNLERQLDNYHSLQKLSDLNEARFKAGDIAEADFLQARVAALEALSQLHAAESTLRQAKLGLAVMIGNVDQRVVDHPVGDLHVGKKTFNLDNLIANAISGRPDVRAALHGQELAEAQLTVAKANRVPDVTASLNYAHNSESDNAYAQSPSNDQIGFTLSVPLPFANFNVNDITAAKLGVEQAERQLEAAKMQAETDVRQAYARYTSAVRAVDQFTNGIVGDSEKVMGIRLYSYKKGNDTLIDVLSAQGDLNNTYLNYYSALNEQAKALVNLEQVSGFWDLDF